MAHHGARRRRLRRVLCGGLGHLPVKRRRPVASGALRPRTAIAAGASLIAIAIAGALFIGPWGLAVVIGSYAALSIAYSLRLKREPVVELAVVASCFVLRAVAGGVVAHVPLSNWFLVFTSFAALFVVTGKRCAEHARLGQDRGDHRQVLDEYTQSFLKSTLTISATVTVASYCLWAFERTGLLAHAGNEVVWVELTVIPLVLAVLHISACSMPERAESPSSSPCTTTSSRAMACSGSR